MNVTEDEKAAAVDKINTLLLRIGQNFDVTSLEECIPTLWVLLLEGIRKSRLRGVMREPDLPGADASHAYHLNNAQAVLWALKHEILHRELPHLTAENIVRVEPRTLVDLASIMCEVANTIDIMNVTEQEKANAVHKINALFLFNRTRKMILSLEECTPAIWILLLEGIRKSRLQGVMQEPDLPGDDIASHAYRLYNAQAVLLALRHEILHQELPHLTAENIVRADLRTLVDLASIMWKIAFPVDTMNVTEQEKANAVHKINALFLFNRTRKMILSLEECTPAIWILLLQGIRKSRLQGVIREPDLSGSADASHAYRLHNAQAVLLALRHEILHQELPHLTAENIVRADLRTLVDLASIMWKIAFPVDTISQEIYRVVSEGHTQFVSKLKELKQASATYSHIHVGVRGTRDYREPPPEHDDGDELDELLGVHSDADSDGGESDASHSLRHRAKKSRPNSSSQSRAGEHTTLAERNLDAFTKRVRREVPIVHTKFPSAAETDRAARRAQTTAAQRAKAQLNEQARRIKRMENRQKSVEEDVRRIAEQRRAKEEAMLRGLLDEHVAAQRAAILDERRLERDERRALDEGRKLKEVSQRAGNLSIPPVREFVFAATKPGEARVSATDAAASSFAEFSADGRTASLIACNSANCASDCMSSNFTLDGKNADGAFSVAAAGKRLDMMKLEPQAPGVSSSFASLFFSKQDCSGDPFVGRINHLHPTCTPYSP
ncbi:Centrosomal protein of 95 kDa [Polyrhizophydium stewartii]|uniref:Centrosomal protein of 95 kDa n=1 Tax=Polyrhizophydium stewartii TaxID=2732419 RepID=A0ABR4NHR1_9FUNG